MAKNKETPKIGIMLDIESLALGPDCVITQLGLVGWYLDDPEAEFIQPVHHFLPIDPQQELIPPRKIRGNTIIWWMKQEAAAREKFQESDSEDFVELQALVRHFCNRLRKMTEEGPYELWARGPQFDVTAVESLIQQLGFEVPWTYDSVRDLRTLMALAGVSSDDVAKPVGMIQHHAMWDCKFQIACYHEAMKQLRSRD